MIAYCLPLIELIKINKKDVGLLYFRSSRYWGSGKPYPETSNQLAHARRELCRSTHTRQ